MSAKIVNFVVRLRERVAAKGRGALCGLKLPQAQRRDRGGYAVNDSDLSAAPLFEGFHTPS